MSDTDIVRLSVPATLEYVRIVRLAASGMASRNGFDVDEIENLRVAVDELASMVVDAATEGELAVSFANVDGDFCIEGRAPTAGGTELTVDTLTGSILNAVCDKYELNAADGWAQFVCLRRLPTS
jgi:serine/threonine-protein kinase RsbW